MQMTYDDCYRILQVQEYCNWDELRLAYRRRIRACHPDRIENGHGNRQGDDEFKRVVKAYRLVAEFHRVNGKLPPRWMVASEDPLPLADVLHAGPRRPFFDRVRRGLSELRAPQGHHLVFAVFIAGLSVAAIAGHFQKAADRPGTVERSSGGPLAVGMQPRDVMAIQGVPQKTKGSVWFYGESGVIFDRGCVIGWENAPPFPLDTLLATTYHARANDNPLSSEHCRKKQGSR